MFPPIRAPKPLAFRFLRIPAIAGASLTAALIAGAAVSAHASPGTSPLQMADVNPSVDPPALAVGIIAFVPRSK
jgi:hypothetical protein